MIVSPALLRATWWTRPRGSASDTSVASLLTPAIPRLSTLCGFVVLSSLRRSAMLGCATCLGTTRPGRKPTMARVIGYTPCQAGGPTHFLIMSFAGDSSNELGSQPQGPENLVDVHPQGANAATTFLDPLARHAGLCNKGLYTRRHDRVRDHIALVARQAGLTAQVEQNMFVPGQTLDDGQPAPGSVRPIHRADLHIIEPTGSELWLDVRIHTVAPKSPCDP